ncbi:MAG TPA: heavy metal-binding domain-containing protein [Mycobacteriales bacterium]|nr:heavy metal-binding domain-containing protein [Mycobacteriales bacterium]
MAGIRAGRIWVAHGDLIRGLEVRVRATGGDRNGVTLGGQLKVRRGATVEVSIKVTMAGTPNFAQFVPTLARVDMVTGDVTGAAPDRDTFTTPRTTVARSWDVSKSSGSVLLTHTFRNVRDPFYLRLRGTDGKQLAAGLLGSSVDPSGPAIDVVGDADQALYDARELAMERMQREAEALSAEGIVGVQLSQHNHAWGGHTTEFFAVGTAVRPIRPDHVVPAPQLVLGLER